MFPLGILCQRNNVPFSLDVQKIMLLLHFDGLSKNTFADSSDKFNTVNKVNTPLVTSLETKFGEGALTSDGTGHLSIPASANFDIGVGQPFTIQFWYWPKNNNGGGGIFSMRNGAGYCPIEINAQTYADAPNVWIGNLGLTGWTQQSFGTVSLSTWHHFAVVGDGTNISVYTDGVFRTSVPQPAWTSANWPVVVGKNGDGYVQSSSYIEELSVHKEALWSANFTPPTEPFGRVEPLLQYNFNEANWTNAGKLGQGVGGIVVGQSVAGGSASFTGGRLYNKWCIWTLNGSGSVAQASQPFEFVCDLEIIASTQLPLVSKTNAVNGGSTGWEIGFTSAQLPYFKNLSTGVSVFGSSSAPLNSVFNFKVASDGTNHTFYFDGVNSGVVTMSTSSVQITDLIHINNNYFLGEFYLDNFYFQ